LQRGGGVYGSIEVYDDRGATTDLGFYVCLDATYTFPKVVICSFVEDVH